MGIMTSQELRQSITEKIVYAMRAGVPPWRRPWAAQNVSTTDKVDLNIGLPTNALTGKHYRGVNILLLNLTAHVREYPSKWWGTEKQWARIKCRIKPAPDYIRESDWATTIYTYLPPTGNRFRGLLRKYKVYNVSQVDGEVENFMPKSKITDPCYRLSDDVVKATKARIVYGGVKATYYRDSDHIEMPYEEQFLHSRFFHGTRFHELCHWAEPRLKWNGSYALGELVAEMGALFLCEMTKIPPVNDWENHASYLKAWIEELNNDDRAIFVAAGQASRAADHIMSYHKNQLRLVV